MTQGPVSTETGCPAWMVVSARLRLSGEMQAMPLEFRMENTSLEEEGAGFISRTRLWKLVAAIFWSGYINGKKKASVLFMTCGQTVQKKMLICGWQMAAQQNGLA